jgi:DNA (cytosine-5)-methyltransferase 1
MRGRKPKPDNSENKPAAEIWIHPKPLTKVHDLTHLDLFSGIGGFALAARDAGFRTVGFSEVEPYACRVLEERFPGVPNIGDVRQRANFARFRGCTVLTGGFPCQPWSEAGKRRGKEDHRHLWPAMCDVITTARPTWIIGENVPGIIGVGLEDVCADLESRGYTTQPLTIPAVAAGAPHLRERVWILAHANSRRRGPNSPAGNNPNGHDAEWRETDRELAASGVARGAENMAHPDSVRGLQPQGCVGEERRWTCDGSWWVREPGVARVAYGIPAESHRRKGLGNAIVPQVAVQFFHFIAAIERGVPVPNAAS